MSQEKIYTDEEVYSRFPYLKKLEKDDLIKLVTEFMIFMIRDKNDGDLHVLNAIKSIIENSRK